MDGSSACRDQQRLLLAAECPSEAKPAAAEAEAFAGAVGVLGRHKLGLDAPGSSATWMAMMAMAVDSRRI